MGFNEDFERAKRNARKLRASEPRAVNAWYDRRLGRVVIHLNSKLDVMVAPQAVRWSFSSSSSKFWPLAPAICPRCWRGSSDRGSGWPAASARKADVHEALPSAPRQRRMAGWAADRRRRSPPPELSPARASIPVPSCDSRSPSPRRAKGVPRKLAPSRPTINLQDKCSPTHLSIASYSVLYFAPCAP